MNVSANTGRLLKGLAVVALVCVSAQAFAANEYEETFESYADGSAITNASGWTAEGSDASTVITTNYNYTAATMPLSATYGSLAHTKVLSLDTQGDQLTNDVSTVADLGTVYIDQMVYLVPSDEEPSSITNDLSVQAAVYLNSSSNLVVCHGGSDGQQYVFTALTSSNVLPETWVRLTITMDYDSQDAGAPFVNEIDWFKVAVDGATLESATDGFSAPSAAGGSPDGGPWFICMNKGNTTETDQDNLAGVSYMGTGMLDDLVVTYVEPTFEEGGPIGTFTILTVVGANGSIDTDTSFEIASGGTTQIVYTAAMYYEIDVLAVDGTPVPAAAGAVEYTNTYATVGADISNNVTFAVHYSPSGAPATWYGPLGLTDLNEDDGDIYNLYQEYVAGLDPTIAEDFAISSITKDALDYLIITWDGQDSPAVATTLTVQGSATVGGASVAIPGAAVFSGASPNGVWTWTSTAPVPDNVKFLKLNAAE